MLTKRSLLADAASIALGGTIGQAFAQADFPSKAMRVMVGYAAGGGVDIVARLVGEQMGNAFRQTVIVENRSGASAMLAACCRQGRSRRTHAARRGSRRGRDQPIHL